MGPWNYLRRLEGDPSKRGQLARHMAEVQPEYIKILAREYENDEV